MKTKRFIPNVNMQHPFGIGVYTGKRSIMLIETYTTLDDMIPGYRKWLNVTEKSGLASPHPFERKEDGWFKMKVDSIIYS